MRSVKLLAFLWLLSHAFTANAQNPSTYTVDGVFFIENSQIKLGVDLKRGGAITYLSKIGQPNMVNNYDNGRQIQPDYYQDPIPYVPPGAELYGSWGHNGYNTTYAGDAFGTNCPTISHSYSNGTLYVKMRPIFWSLRNVFAEVICEAWYTVIGNRIHVRYKLNNQRTDGYSTAGKGQSVPIMYLNNPYNRCFTYRGDRPYTNDGLVQTNMTVGPGQDNGFRATENWAILVDRNNEGVGMFSESPGVYWYSEWRHPNEGNGEFDNANCILNAAITAGITPNGTWDHEADLVVGNIQAIRDFAYSKRGKTTPLAIASSALNCATGQLTVATSGGDGSGISYQVDGLGTWQSSPTFAVPSAQRNGTTLTIRARQSGQETTTTYTTNCALATTPPPTSPTPAPAPVVTGSFEGFVDVANCDQVSGWVWDRNQPNLPLTVELLDGTTVVATTLASTYRADLQSAGKGNGQHAYWFSLPASVKTGQPRTLSVRVQGSSYLLANSGRSVTCQGSTTTTPTAPTPAPAPAPTPAPAPASPTPAPAPTVTGNFEGYIDVVNCSQISGWVWDRNAPGAALTVELLDGNTVVATTTANTYRADLQSAGKGTGQYAYAFYSFNSLKNNQPHTISLRVKGSSFIISGSTRTLTCASGARLALDAGEVSHVEPVTVYPNPVGETVNVSFYLLEAADVPFTIVNLMGRTVHQQVVSGKAGANRAELKPLLTEPGVYLLQATIDNKPVVKKLLKN